MSHPQINVCRVTPELERDFIALWMSARVETGTTPESAVRIASEGRVSAALAREDVHAYLAIGDPGAIGYMVLTLSPLTGLTDSPCVSIDQLYVAPQARRLGAARALLAVAAAYADRLGAEQIASLVPANGREANRFFARLGFSPHVVRRVTTTTALHRKLAAAEQRPGLDPVLVQRRRSLRARASRASAHLVGG